MTYLWYPALTLAFVAFYWTICTADSRRGLRRGM